MMIRAALASLVLLAAACSPDDTHDTVGQGTAPPGDFLVPVTLTEHEIDLPETAPAGALTFQLNNQGQQSHSFVIEGDGVDEQIDIELRPGETRNFTVALEPGTYIVWCPIGDHRERGMEAQIEITESGDDPDAPLGDEAIEPEDDPDEIDD
jgi:hypothetical protein